MKTSLPTNDTHTFFPETSKAVSMGVPTQYNHLTQDHQSKSWRYEQVMQSMILTKPPRSQYQAAQLDHGTPNTFSSESVATVGQSIPRVFQSQVAGHQARPLVCLCLVRICWLLRYPTQFSVWTCCTAPFIEYGSSMNVQGKVLFHDITIVC